MNSIFLRLKLLFYQLISNPLFIIAFRKDQFPVIKGSVKNSFLADCSEILRRENISSGIVYAVKGKYGKPVLKASGKIPAPVLQQLRNTWSFNS